MGEKFQAKKLNKDDHKGIKGGAGIVKIGLGVLCAVVLAAPFIKKHGKDMVDIAKNITSKK